MANEVRVIGEGRLVKELVLKSREFEGKISVVPGLNCVPLIITESKGELSYEVEGNLSFPDHPIPLKEQYKNGKISGTLAYVQILSADRINRVYKINKRGSLNAYVLRWPNMPELKEEQTIGRYKIVEMLK